MIIVVFAISGRRRKAVGAGRSLRQALSEAAKSLLEMIGDKEYLYIEKSQVFEL